MSVPKPPAALPSKDFQPLIYGVGAWTPHLYFGYDIVATTRPRLVVELGTDRGESYFAFCQAIVEQKINARAVAIDSWKGDAQAGSYDEETYAQVGAHNQRYAHFSTLRRGQFDEAVAEFDNESIDLLHLDGCHAEDAVRHDLTSWLPKLRGGGFLLLHDVHVKRAGFGVAKVWNELSAGPGRAFTLDDGPGLGVWQKPPLTQTPEFLHELFGARSGTIRDYYRERTAALQAQIAAHWADHSIGATGFGQQTVIQVFYSEDGTHAEERSVNARIGHDKWKEVTLALPTGAGIAALRIDFVSPFTLVDLAEIRVQINGKTKYVADTPDAFAQVKIAGDGVRFPHPEFLRIRISGVDPQLYLPALPQPGRTASATIHLRLRVSAQQL